MAYKHDVFLSYRRDPFRDEWLIQYFIPIFKSKVREAIAAETGRLPQSIFFDQTDLSEKERAFDLQGIEPGQNWRSALENAIRYSRCAVALWSPMYFHSEWCNIEWRSFYERGNSFNPKLGLVIPATIHDGKAFPQDAQDTQFIDLSKYIISGDGFKVTERYVDFQIELGKFAQRVAEVVAGAPQFDNWTVAAASPKPPPPKIEQPLL